MNRNSPALLPWVVTLVVALIHLLRTDAAFQLTGRWEFDASLGLEALPDGRFLVGSNMRTPGTGHVGRVVLAREDKAKSLVLEKP